MPVFFIVKDVKGVQSVDIQFLLFLMICGALSGALYATTKLGSALFVVPTVLLFMPVFHLSAHELLLPVIATAITAMIPMLLLDWVDQMKAQKVDSKYLIAFAPGAAMGGVIGAQIVSLMPFSIFPFFLIFLSLAVVLNVYWHYRPLAETSKWRIFQQLQRGVLKLPVALFLSCISVLSASTGKPLFGSLLSLGVIKQENLEPTTTGLALFAAIAAMVGFAFPAESFIYSGSMGFVGAIHLLSCLILTLSQFVTFCLCRNKGSRLDIAVVYVAAIAFLLLATFRLLIL